VVGSEELPPPPAPAAVAPPVAAPVSAVDATPGRRETGVTGLNWLANIDRMLVARWDDLAEVYLTTRPASSPDSAMVTAVRTTFSHEEAEAVIASFDAASSDSTQSAETTKDVMIRGFEAMYTSSSETL